jgi:hypothetical protein
MRGDIVRAVAHDDSQAPLAERKMEHPVRGRDHAHVDLERNDARLRQLPVNVLRERAAAEAHERYVARLGMEQQPRHHRAGVCQRQIVGCVQAHGALDRAAPYMQMA